MMRLFRNILNIFLASALAFSCAGNIDPEDRNTDEDGDQTGDQKYENLDSGYAQKMLAMQFTSTGCVECPLLGDALKNISTNYPGKLISVALHMDYGNTADPMTLAVNGKFYEKVTWHSAGTVGLPLLSLNFRKGSQHVINEYAKIEAEMKSQAALYPAVCGVALETTYDKASRKVEVKASFNPDVAGEYRYHIFLVESSISGYQAGVESGNYVHDNVLRALAADNVLGARLNSGKDLVPGTEYKVTKTFSLAEDWKSENMKVVAAVLNSQDEGKTYGVNNANACIIGEKAEYEYENK